MGSLTVNGHESSRLNDGEHQLELLGTRMAGNMDTSTRLVVNVSTDLGKRVNNARNGLFIAGNRSGRNDNGIALLDFNGSVVAVCDSRKGRKRLTLRTSAHNDDPIARNALQLISIDEIVVVN